MVKQTKPDIASEKTKIHQLNQSFDGFMYRCTFMITALEKMAFDDNLPNREPSALGASLYVGDLIEELAQFQEMIEEIYMETSQLESAPPEPSENCRESDVLEQALFGLLRLTQQAESAEAITFRSHHFQKPSLLEITTFRKYRYMETEVPIKLQIYPCYLSMKILNPVCSLPYF